MSSRHDPTRFAALALSCAAVMTAAVLAGCSQIPDPRPLTQDAVSGSAEPTGNSGAGPVPSIVQAVPNPHDSPRLPEHRATAGRVMGVTSDGVLKVLFEGGVTQRVRLIGVRIPRQAPAQPFGSEAIGYVRRAVDDKVVYVVPDSEQRDRQNNLMAYVWLQDESNTGDLARRASLLNARVLIDGMGRVVQMAPDSTFDEAFTGYEAEARAERRGLWSLQTYRSADPLPDETLGAAGASQ